MKGLVAFLGVLLVFVYPWPSRAQDLDRHLLRRINFCKDHFDIRPYMAISFPEWRDQAPSLRRRDLLQVAENLRALEETGSFSLTPAEEANPSVQRCAAFAEGFFTGSLYTESLKALGFLLREAIEEIIQEVETRP